VAKNDEGNPLSTITVKTVQPDSLPGIPEGSTFTLASMAYDLQPDNSTFSPSISLNLTVPQAQWGRDFMVKTYDDETGEWLDVPECYDPDTGVVTSQISHSCLFALFSQADAAVPATTITATTHGHSSGENHPAGSSCDVHVLRNYVLDPEYDTTKCGDRSRTGNPYRCDLPVRQKTAP
jgi:hypothetical protein